MNDPYTAEVRRVRNGYVVKVMAFPDDPRSIAGEYIWGDELVSLAEFLSLVWPEVAE